MEAFLAWFLRSVLRYRSDVVTVNLSRSFPEKTYDELAVIHKRFYRHLAVAGERRAAGVSGKVTSSSLPIRRNSTGYTGVPAS